MRHILFLFILITLTNVLSAQYVYTIKADSVKLTHCDSSELIIENHTQNVPGFLFNTGNGRTVFKKAVQKINDSTYLIGADTLKVQPPQNSWSIFGNAGTVPGTNFIGTRDSVALIIKVNNRQAGKISMDGEQNTFWGYQTGNTGVLNTGLGYKALGVTTGSRNTAVGATALTTNTTGGFNTAVGSNALSTNTTGGVNTAVGSNALSTNTTGGFNIAVGSNTLSTNSSGSHNTAVGFASLFKNTTGTSNVAIGENSLAQNSTGTTNSAFGLGTISANTTGSGNTALGYSALHDMHTGNYNIGIGYSALAADTTSLYSIGIGYRAGEQATGSNNIFIGANAGYNITTQSNILLINSSASLSDSNKALIFGDFTSGRVGLGSQKTPQAILDVLGDGKFSDSLVLKTVANGNSADSLLTINATSHAIHKIAQGSLVFQHTIFTPTTGQTVTLVNNIYNIINPSGSLASLTINLPASPANNDVVMIKFIQPITTITYTGGTVARGGIISESVPVEEILTYDSATSTWY